MSGRFRFRARLTPAEAFDPADTGFVVEFPDWPAGVTQGEDEADALDAAADALGVLVACAVKEGSDIPEPADELGPGEHWIEIEPLLAAKAGLYLAMRDAAVNRSELARRMGIDAKEVRRLLDPRIGTTRLPRIQQALAVLGKRLTVEVRDAA